MQSFGSSKHWLMARLYGSGQTMALRGARVVWCSLRLVKVRPPHLCGVGRPALVLHVLVRPVPFGSQWYHRAGSAGRPESPRLEAKRGWCMATGHAR